MKRVIATALAMFFMLGLIGCSDNQEQLEDENGSIVAAVTEVSTKYITIEITDAGNTPFEVEAIYSISMSDKLPDLGVGDYIRVVCNPSAVQEQSDIPLIEEVTYVSKTDETGMSVAD